MTRSSYETRAWLEHIERLWQDQYTFFPSVPSYKYEFPRSVDYYRYLNEDTLSHEIEILKGILEKLQEDAGKLTQAIRLCRAMTPDEYGEFLTLIPWILTAHKTVAYLDNYHDDIVVNFIPEEYTWDMKIETLRNQRRIFDNQIRHLGESIQVLEYISSRQPKPAPFIDMHKKAYEDGEIVVGFYDEQVRGRWTAPYLLMVSDSSVGTYHMAVRPLTDEELENRPVNLPTAKFQGWMRRASYGLVMSLEAYRYYLDHPGLVDEHIEIIRKSSSFDFVIPTALMVLSRHFKNQ